MIKKLLLLVGLAIPAVISAYTSGEKIFWNDKIDCSACHVLEKRSLNSEVLLAGVHAGAGETCISCHGGKELSLKHVSIDKVSAVRVPVKKYSGQFCLKCHGTTADLIERTADSRVYADIKGKIVNPHDSHLGVANCNVCHRMHRISAGLNHCYTCHHDKVFECGTCHPIPQQHP